MRFNNLKIILKIFLTLILTLFGLRTFSSKDLVNQKNYSQQFLDRHQNLLRLTLSGDEKYRQFADLSEIDSNLIEKFILKEDQYFYFHFGFNAISLLRATYKTFLAPYLKTSFRQGGSTLTMQVVRLLYPETTNTFSGKFIQILKALKLEILYSKSDILTAYLNWIPFGSNIEGVRSACLIYFNKTCKKLTPHEIDFLVQIPQNPNKFLSIAHQHKKKLVFKAPHFVDYLIQKGDIDKNIVTTLDLKFDQEIYKISKKYFDSLKNYGIKNYSIVIANSKNGEILSYVGSANYFDLQIKGQIDANRTLKSPGSTLKPIIYALGLQQGLIHEKTLLKDTRMRFSGIDPENFDQDFLGPLSADQALVLSRNLPAVTLGMKLKDPSLYEFLKDKSSLNFKDENYYGLSLALGGVEFSMLDIIRLYAILGRLGKDIELQWKLPPKTNLNTTVLENSLNDKLKSKINDKNILNEEAVYILMHILEKNQRTESSTLTQLTPDKIPVAWKTGTSKSYKDAWTVGLIGSLVVGVWLGDNDKEMNPAVVGRQVAAPLFFQIYDFIQNSYSSDYQKYRDDYPKWKNKIGLNITSVPVCSVSKNLRTENCGHHHEDSLFIPSTSPIESCTIHRKINTNIDSKSGLNSNFQIVEVWPDDLLDLFRQSGLKKNAVSEKKISLQSVNTSLSELQITSPQEHVKYLLYGQKNKLTGQNQYQTRISLKAISESDSTYLDWYMNRLYIGRALKNESLFFKIENPGTYFVSVTDSLGRQSSTQFEVQLSSEKSN